MKKLVRSLLVFAPWLQDARFAAEARVLRALGRPFRAEFAGLRALDLTDASVVDIGCNRGISISTIRSMMPTARIVGYEANPGLAAATAARFASDPSIQVRAAGLGDRAGTFRLHLPVYRGYRFDGLASFDPVAARALFNGELLYGFDERRLSVEVHDVTTRPLDDDALAPDVIKLYVQGHERAVLEGASRTLARCEPIVIAPSHHRDVDAFLRSRGYRRYQWRAGRFEREADFGYVVYYATADRARRSGMDVEGASG